MTVYTPHVGDIGTRILVDTESDISRADIVRLLVKKNTSVLSGWVGAVIWVGTAVDATKIEYYTIAGDFDTAGSYELQAYVAFYAPGSTVIERSWTGTVVTFEVFQALPHG
jgi:hypothetical protein